MPVSYDSSAAPKNVTDAFEDMLHKNTDCHNPSHNHTVDFSGVDFTRPGCYTVTCSSATTCHPLGSIWVVSVGISSASSEIAKGTGSTAVTISYQPSDLDKKSIKLEGDTEMFEFYELGANGAKINNLSWSVPQSGASKSFLVKGKKVGKGKLKVLHDPSGAIAETEITVTGLDLIIDNVGEDKEEMSGVFIGYKKRKTLELKAEPKTAGENVTLSLSSDLKLFDAEQDGNEITARSWPVANIPETLYVEGTATSQSMRDESATATFMGINDTVNMTVVGGNMAAGSLTDFDDGKPLEAGHAYVHWNIDNDDDSTDGDTKHPGRDYKQDTYQLTLSVPPPGGGPTPPQAGPDNDEMQSLKLSVTPSDLNIGTIKLTIGASAKLWKHAAKDYSGNKNLVVASGEKTWDLSDPVQKQEFETLKEKLLVEGISGGGGTLLPVVAS